MGFRQLIGLAAAILGIAGAAVAQPAQPKPDEMVNTPPFQHWSSFKVGAKVTQKQVVTLPDGQKVAQTIVQKLTQKSPQKVVVETVVTDNAKGIAETTRTTTTYSPKIRMSEVGSASSSDATVTEGKEEMTLRGKKVAAEWVEAVTKSGDDVWKEKMWTAQSVPGGIVKQTVVHERGGKVVSESVLEVVDFTSGS